MAKIDTTSIFKGRPDNEVSDDLKGSYGRAVIIMSSNPEEIDIVCNKLGKNYKVIMETEVLDNHDYAKVILRDQ